jgi:hypothetical protein
MTQPQRKGLSKKQLASMSKWANRPRPESPDQVTERQRALWDAINELAVAGGAAITSPKYADPLRLEISVGSSLADTLKEFGHDLIFLERATRIGGNATPDYGARWRQGVVSGGYGFTQVDAYSIQLKSK